MTDNQAANQAVVQDSKPSDKEFNFRKVEAQKREAEKAWEQERQARLDLERQLNELKASANQSKDDDESDDEPYVAPKKLEKKLAKFGQSTQSEIQKAMEVAKQAAKEELKQEMWLEGNPDFYDIMEKYTEKFYHKAPKLADNILKMPNNFERQKLVYQTIKELGLDKPEPKQSSVQDTIDANKRSPYYQPSGVGTAPYAAAGDFSAAGQKNAYSKMKELQNRLRG